MTNLICCTQCSYSTDDLQSYYCPLCWGPVRYQIGKQASQNIHADSGSQGLWRYAHLLPQEIDIPDDFNPGWTPLASAPGLAERWGVKEVWVKDETANPTHSFKDRVVALALARALYLGQDTLACTSTGNLGHALSAACARLGLRAVILVPESIEKAKISAARALGGEIVAIRGSYDDVNRTAHQLADQTDWGWVNMTLRPFYAEGSKTVFWEILDQLGETPTDVVAPAASGSLYSKLAAAADQSRPGHSIRFHAAQAEGCSPIAQAFISGEDHPRPVRPESRAHSLAIGNPADGANALRAARQSGGQIVSVPEEFLPQGVGLLGKHSGVLTESAGAVTTLGAEHLARKGAFDADSRVVLVITGDGLKGTDLVEDSVAKELKSVPADPHQVLSLLDNTAVVL